MNLETISNTFDTRLKGFSNEIIDEYEKSIYLTLAQDNFYNDILSKFEETSDIALRFSKLLKEVTLTSSTQTALGGHIVEFANHVRAIFRERVTVGGPTIYDGKTLLVHEERLAEIEESIKNPFRRPGPDVVLRAVIEQGTTYKRVELYLMAGLTLTNYKAVLGLEPNPIVLETLPDNLEVHGQNTATTSLSFDDDDLGIIINIAVQLALNDIMNLVQNKES